MKPNLGSFYGTFIAFIIVNLSVCLITMQAAYNVTIQTSVVKQSNNGRSMLNPELFLTAKSNQPTSYYCKGVLPQNPKGWVTMHKSKTS